MSTSVHCKYDSYLYADNLLKNIKDYRENHTLCDTTIIIEDTRISAHGLILSAASPYFSNRLLREHPTYPFELRLYNVTVEAVTTVVDYLYAAEITINQENAPELLEAACLLQIDNLKFACCEVLQSCLSLETAARTRHLAFHHDCTDLQQACEDYIQGNMGRIFSDPEFLEQGFEDFVTNVCPLSDILTDDQMCHAVTSWVNHRKETRQPFVTMFLQKMVHLSDRIQQTIDATEEGTQIARDSVDSVASQPSPTLSSETILQPYHPRSTQKTSNFNPDHVHVKIESVQDFSDLSTGSLDADDSNLQSNVMPDVLMQRTPLSRSALQSDSKTMVQCSLSVKERLQQRVSHAKSPETSSSYAASEIYLPREYHPDEGQPHTSGHHGDSYKQKDIRSPRFSCEICGDRFTTKSSLTNHHRIHTGDRPFECQVCGNRFSQSGTLVNHLKIHTNAKAHKCEICGKGFNRAFVLREHMRTHTKEKPFKCCFCWSRFGQRRQLKSHMRIHAGELVPKASSTVTQRACGRTDQIIEIDDSPPISYADEES